MSQTLLEMAKDLILAQIHAQKLSPEDMHTALQQTYSSLLALQAQEDSNGTVVVATPETPTAVNWRKSITKYHVTCLVCGASFKQLSVRHLREHALDARSYRVQYGIPRNQPLSARSVTAIRKQIVQETRPWEKAPTYLKAHEKAKQAVAQKKGRAQRKVTARAKA